MDQQPDVIAEFHRGRAPQVAPYAGLVLMALGLSVLWIDPGRSGGLGRRHARNEAIDGLIARWPWIGTAMCIFMVVLGCVGIVIGVWHRTRPDGVGLRLDSQGVHVRVLPWVRGDIAWPDVAGAEPHKGLYVRVRRVSGGHLLLPVPWLHATAGAVVAWIEEGRRRHRHGELAPSAVEKSPP